MFNHKLYGGSYKKEGTSEVYSGNSEEKIWTRMGGQWYEISLSPQ